MKASLFSFKSLLAKQTAAEFFKKLDQNLIQKNS